MSRKRLHRPKPLGRPVSGKSLFKNGITILENHEWLPYLTKHIVDEHGTRKRVGLNPKEIDPEILTASGHPPKSATSRIKAYLKDLDKIHYIKKDKGIKRLRELCLDCAATSKAVRECAIINCPLWNHRMGFNPHTWHKRHTLKEDE